MKGHFLYVIYVVSINLKRHWICAQRAMPDGGAVYVMVVQEHMGVRISIAMNACEDALPQCRLVSFLSITLLPSSKPSFLLYSLQPSV